MANLPKVIAIVGPTSSGKTALGVALARKYNGEIVSADSRQIYRGMDIGTAKATEHEMRGVPHHLLGITSPKRTFTVAEYRTRGIKALNQIIAKEKLPIVVGGTGFYIDALFSDMFPDVKPNPKLRKTLDALPVKTLFAILKKKDPRRAKTIDPANKRRLVRALEIIAATGKPIPSRPIDKNKYDILFLGLRPNARILHKRIHDRLALQLRHGMIAEVRRLHEKDGVSWKRLDDLGLEYRYVSRYLRHLLTKQEMIAQLETEVRRYAKRQMTWFKKNKEIRWIAKPGEAEKMVEEFLKTN